MSSVITGVSVGVVMLIINSVAGHFHGKKNKDREVIHMLLKSTLVLLVALKRSGIVNGDCDEILDELNDFLIKK